MPGNDTGATMSRWHLNFKPGNNQHHPSYTPTQRGNCPVFRRTLSWFGVMAATVTMTAIRAVNALSPLTRSGRKKTVNHNFAKRVAFASTQTQNRPMHESVASSDITTEVIRASLKAARRTP